MGPGFGLDPLMIQLMLQQQAQGGGGTPQAGPSAPTGAGSAVAPAGFTGVMAAQPIDVWLPITTWFDRHSIENPEAFMFRVIARRKPGTSERAAQANVQLLARQWSSKPKSKKKRTVASEDMGGF